MRKLVTNILSYLFALLVLLSAIPAGAVGGRVFIRGIVRDSVTSLGLPYASVTLDGAPGQSQSTVADSKGIFEMMIPDDARSITASCVGYARKTVPLKTSGINLYDILLSPETTQLKEVVVKKKKYSKKNNPAVDFAVRLRNMSPENDPRLRHPYYNYEKYERMTLGLNDFDVTNEGNAVLKKFPFLAGHVDTSDVSGKPVLPLSVKEKVSQVHFRRDPELEKEVVKAFKSDGIDEIATQENVQKALEDILREVDLFQNDIAILRNRFVSPLSKIAPDFYKFYLVDTVEVEGDRCVMLSFYPHNPAAFGFNGHIFVPVNDSTMFIRKVEMKSPKGINLNFIDELYLSQTFDRAADGTRLKKSDDLMLEMTVIPGTPSLFARRNVAYSNHDFNPPADSTVFDGLGRESTDRDASGRDSVYWASARKIEMKSGEEKTAELTARLREVPLYYWSEKILKILFSGYVRTGHNSKIDLGPVNTLASYNSLEGVRFRVGGMTTANLSPRWFGRGYVAYGLRDHKWKYKGEVEYSFHDKAYHSREFPVHSLRLTHSYDVDHIGQHYLFTNSDNFVLSLKRMSDHLDTYRRQTMLEYTLELRNNFSVHATLSTTRQERTRFFTFIDGAGRTYDHYMENGINVELRYAPGEKFVQSKSYRVPLNLDAPVFILSHTFVPKGFLGSTFGVNKTEFNVQKRFWLSAFGYVDVMAGGGHVWGQSAFPDLLIPNANLSYTIQPQSFALMNAMEFVNSSYASWDLTYWLNGALLNYIPLVKKLKLREVVAFRGIWGTLNKKNTPGPDNPSLFLFPGGDHSRKMGRTPYMEASVGLDNILRCIRLDYVWRLSYLHPSYPIDRRGLRVAMHFTF